jgi:hypothetical protein
MLEIVYRPPGSLRPFARNARTHSAEQIAEIAASIKRFGWTNPCLIDEEGEIIAGHGRVEAATLAGHEQIPTITLPGLSQAEKRALVIADNQIPLNAGWNEDLLRGELLELRGLGEANEIDFGLGLLGFSDAALEALLGEGKPKPETGSLADKFMVAPFSVLNAREGWWQERKRAWLALGIKSELGRGGRDGVPDAPGGGGGGCWGLSNADYAAGAKGKTTDQQRAAKRAPTAAPGGSPMVSGYSAAGERQAPSGEEGDSGTSIFDPVLCEIAYRWFSPPAGLVLDPFAAKLGKPYVGVDLSGRQLEANRRQGEALLGPEDPQPRWIEGDSRGISGLARGVLADLVFSCPPYADLEVYSDHPDDLSTMPWAKFRAAYRECVAEACSLLRLDRFACFVVGEVRDRKGNYIDFVGETVQAFRDAGLEFYNEAILITAAGSLPIRAGKQFSASRKLGKTHQNILVFLKGNAKRAVAACGPVEVDPSLLDEAEEPLMGG